MEQPHEQQQPSCLQGQERLNLGGSDKDTEIMILDPCQRVTQVEDSRLVGVPVTLARDVDMTQREDGCLPATGVKLEVQVAGGSVGKRKRGRPAKGLPKTPPLRKKMEEEDVCFICFDGGSLVLCDSRGCPKAYHPACIKRDESYFRSKAKWNCGWHICSICQKASHYMCYTCTYSLCKGCTKDADFLCVRGSKGLCGICLKTIMLIENSAQGNKEMCEVDFDDKSSWEYLFKVYWMYLKGKLSLTLDELFRAKNPWKGAAAMGCKVETPHELHYLRDEKGSRSANSCIEIQSNNIKDNSREANTVGAGIIDVVAGQVEANDNYNNQQKVVNDMRHKTCKKADVRVPQINRYEYAAINAHNINLIYMRRNQMENLIEDAEKFHEKVVGSIVRRRISFSDQNQEMYRLVQVVGTSKVAEPYKIGTRTTDIVLEILNLNKKEVISIEEISNQEFSEDECSRLCQSIRYGLLKRLTVGEILDKALTLQDVRVNDLLEAEILQLNHLCAKAIEKGHRKEVIECVEKLQLLNSPEERQRRLHEIPEIHSDPHMDSMFESDEDAGRSDERKQDDNIGSKDPGFDQRERELNSSRSWGGVLNGVGCRTRDLPVTHEQIRNIYMMKNQINADDTAIGDSNNVVVRSEESDVALDLSSLPVCTGRELQFNETVTDKLWHYRDPTGKVEGPFSMLQLYKRNADGLFPPDLRIWRINETQDDSVILINALSGKCYKNVSSPERSQMLPSGVTVALDDGDNSQDGGRNATRNKIHANSRTIKQSCEQKLDDLSTRSSGKDKSLRSNEFHSDSSSWTIPADANHNEGLNGISEKREESSKSEIFFHAQPRVCPSPSAALSEKLDGNHSYRLREDDGTQRNTEKHNGNHDSNRTSEGQSHSEQIYKKQSNSEENSGQSSRHNCRGPRVNSISNCLVSMSAHDSVTKTSPPNLEIDLSRLIPVSSSSNCWDSTSDFVSVTKPSPNNPDIDFLELRSHTSKPNNAESTGHSSENKQSASSDVPVQEAGPIRSTASSLVNGGTPLHEVTVEWRRCSRAPPNPSVEEWDSNVVSASSLQPTETVGDCIATPSSMSQLSHSSPSQACNTSDWQAIINEPNADESVSDLLAEVEAIESLGGLESPTSIMTCGEDLTERSKTRTDCLGYAEGLSPMPDVGKGDALSSTADLQLPSQSTAVEEPLQRTDVHNHHRISEHSSRSFEVDVGTKNSCVSGTRWESGSEIPSTATWDMATDGTLRLGSESTIGGWEASQGNANRGWRVGQGTMQENRSINSYSSSTGNPGCLGSQTRYGSDRYSASRDRGFHGYGRESGFGRGRTVCNRQTLFGVGNGGSHRPPPKGQRICKFYESGYCKKGASCDYLHR